MRRRLFYCDCYEIPLPAGHRFPMRKYSMLRDALGRDGFYRLEQAPFASRDDILLAHDPTYVDRFLAGTLDSAVIRRIGFPWSEGLVRRTFASVGGTLAATGDALDAGFGGNLAGGTHHAFRESGSGFCVFNDIAVAICAYRQRNAFRRAAVVDLDVHQGDGTAKIFEDDPGVLTLSMHSRANFPFRKQVSRIDVELLDETTDQAYLEALGGMLPRVFDFGPEIVFFQSGVDALASDKLGRLSLTHAGLKERDRMVFTACHTRGVPIVTTLGGGYSDPIEDTVEAHANTFRTAASIFGAPERIPADAMRMA
jgi:acetoin utilization deacetylase AcuC-like enzyme